MRRERPGAGPVNRLVNGLADRLGTVRGKLTVLATLLVAVVLATSAVGLVIVQQRLLLRGIDEALRQRVDNIAGTIARGGFGHTLPGEGDPEDSFLQVLGPDGRVLAASSNAAGLPPAVPVQPAGSTERLTTLGGIALSSNDFRVLVRRVGTGPDAPTLVVAKNLDDVSESVRILESSLAISLPLVTLVLGWLVWWLTGRALRPVESIRAEVADIQGTELHRRVPTPATHDEISRLANTMNAMLDRVEQTTEGQRRFVADASHELRGPLTRMRSSLEVAIAHPGTTEPEEVYRSARDDAVDLQQLVDDLLFLARSDAGAMPVVGDPVDLDDLVLAEARRLREETRVRVDTSEVSGARTSGDQRQLARVVRNLAGNAARHACSEVRLELREDRDRCVLVVADDGPGVPREHRATVFHRFTRLDDARTPDAGGAGLGLAIVADIVSRHGGEVAIEDGSGDGAGARFVVRLPRAD